MTTAFATDDRPLTVEGARHHVLLSSQPTRRLDLRLTRALTEEWTRLCGLGSNDAVVCRWVASEPALPRVGSLTELTKALDAAPTPQMDSMLLALLNLAQRGEQLAGRVLVQQFMGRAIRLAYNQARVTGADPNEVEAQVFAGLWQAVMEYPTARGPRSVAASLALDALRLTQRHWIARWGHRKEDRNGSNASLPAPQELPLQPEVAEESFLQRAAEASTPTEAVLQLLTDAVAHGAITRAEAQLLARAYAPLPGAATRSRDIGDELGLTPEAVRRRLSRLVTRLTQYVRTVELEGADGADLSPTASPRLGACIQDLMWAA